MAFAAGRPCAEAFTCVVPSNPRCPCLTEEETEALCPASGRTCVVASTRPFELDEDKGSFWWEPDMGAKDFGAGEGGMFLNLGTEAGK